MATLPNPSVTLAQYIELEETSEVRHEFYGGEVFEMEAASFRHQRIQAQFAAAASAAIAAKGCILYFAGTRIATSAVGLFTYPDLVLVCGQARFLEVEPNTVTNPKVIVEILSPRTQDYDRGKKFQLYRGIQALEEYINIHQDEPFIEHHTKQREGLWISEDIRGIDRVLRLGSVGIEIPFSVLYS